MPPDESAVPTTVSRLRVRPRHCDAQAVVHASRYYEFFGDAFLDRLDDHMDGHRRLREENTIDLVIVSGGCDYRAPRASTTS